MALINTSLQSYPWKNH